MKKKIAINGFGRIGRLATRMLINHKELELVAINDLTDIPTLAHLFKYDTAHRTFQGDVSHNENSIVINGTEIKAFAIADANSLPWKDLGVDIVLECTGINLTKTSAGAHIQAGAKRVILSAPPKENDIPTFVLGVNDNALSKSETIISNASCTTNCLSPVLKIINEKWGVSFANMNTIHAFTQDQRLQDAPHKDLRRARAASHNIIPTSTGAAKAVEQVYPAIKGKLMASSYRVPIITGSLIELFCYLNKSTTQEEINTEFKKLSETDLKGIIQYQTDPIVSSDIIDNSHSAIFDASLTEVKGNFVKVIAWYENESGYSARLVDMCAKFALLI